MTLRYQYADDRLAFHAAALGLVNLLDTTLPQHSFLQSLEPTMVVTRHAVHGDTEMFSSNDL
jgi:hypothetical protein